MDEDVFPTDLSIVINTMRELTFYQTDEFTSFKII